MRNRSRSRGWFGSTATPTPAYSATTEPIWFRTDGGTVDFGLHGGVLTGLSYWDKNHSDTSKPTEVDFRFFDPKGDVALDLPVLSPAKDTCAVGDEVDITIKVSNKGEAVETPAVVIVSWYGEILSFSDNIRRDRQSFFLNDPLWPGQSVDVKIRAKLTSTELKTVHAIAMESKWGDDDRFGNNVVIRPIKVVRPGAATMPAIQPSETATTSPTTSTTAPAVVKASNSDALASTGASPLGFIALGGLLLVAGAGVFLVARRRRS